MKTFFSIFVLIFACNSCFAQKIGAREIEEIRLKDDGGFGVDKGFEIVIKSGGATFHGKQNFYGRKGDYHGAFGKKQFIELIDLVKAQNFFALKNRYESSVKDVGTRTITVVYRGAQKSVVN